ncbi:MAG TPA: hypothetical protein VFA20_26460 [Myxococcaceae bacterium]|nr:hypothetical protein [Myxococcaceae bacterium]
MAITFALGLWSSGAFASTGFAPQAARATSGGGWVDRSGYPELIYHSVSEGTAVGVEIGFALADFNDPATANRVVLGGALGAAAGLAIPLLTAGSGEVRTGDVVFMGVAHTLGMFNGFFIPFTVQLAQCSASIGSGCFLDPNLVSSRIDFGVSAALSLGAGAATMLVNRQLNLSPGQAEAIGAGAFWGAAVGFLVAFAVPDAIANQPALLTGLGIGGADGGALAAFLLRDFFDMDRSRIWFIDTGVVVGIGAGLALAFFISPGVFNSTAVSIAGIAGGAAGWAVAYFATGGLDGFKQGAPSDRPAAAALDAPTIHPLVSLARGERASGIQIDLIQGRF